MSVSSNSGSYRLLLLSLFLTPFLFSGSNALTATYKCFEQGGKPFIAFFVVAETADKVEEIYAVENKGTCSTKNGAPFSGQGTKTDPYKLAIDVDSDIKTPKCGVKKTGDDAKITFIIKSGKGDIVTAASKEIDVKCNVKNIKIEAVASVAVAYAKGSATEESVKVSMIFKDTPSSLNVGDSTSLVLTLSDKAKFKGIKPYKCWAMRNANDAKKETIVDNYCPTANPPAKLKFAPASTSDPSVVNSEPFNAFRFFDSDKLFISCEVDLCIDVKKCAAASCTTRKRRSVSEANDKLNRLVTTNASIVIRGKGSSLL